MRIGVDTSILRRGGGVSVYISELLSGFQSTRTDHEFVLYSNAFRGERTPLPVPFPAVQSRVPDRILNAFWQNLHFPPISWFIGPVDVFHSPAHSPVYAYSPPAKNWVVTVHDLFTFKLNYKKKTQKLEWKVLKRMERSAKRVIAVSQSTRNDLIELVPGLKSRTVVISEGVDESFFQAESSAPTLKRYGIDSPYLLYVGAADAHKNLIRLVNVFHRLSREIPHALVLAGKITERYRPVMERVDTLKIRERVVFTDRIQEADLRALYQGCALSILPSLYEGFGLVLLEAMASGAPVAASNLSSIPEVVGNTAALFNPYDENDIYRVIREVLSDGNRLLRMRETGIARARLFSWKTMAAETLRIYEEAAR